MIIALAGRRLDRPGANQKRFPPENTERVQRQISDFLKSAEATTLVCAAACGSDILALEAAGALGIRRRVVLPYDREAFKQSSVADCLGDWSERYDRVIADIARSGDLVEYDYEKEEETYFATNHDILDEAEELAEETGQPLAVLVVWNGESRGDDDVTGHFLEEARQRELMVSEVNTL